MIATDEFLMNMIGRILCWIGIHNWYGKMVWRTERYADVETRCIRCNRHKWP